MDVHEWIDDLRIFQETQKLPDTFPDHPCLEGGIEVDALTSLSPPINADDVQIPPTFQVGCQKYNFKNNGFWLAENIEGRASVLPSLTIWGKSDHPFLL